MTRRFDVQFTIPLPARAAYTTGPGACLRFFPTLVALPGHSSGVRKSFARGAELTDLGCTGTFDAGDGSSALDISSKKPK